MPVIQTRVFVREAEAGNLTAGIAAVTDEVNAFLGTFSNPCHVLDVRAHTGPSSKYGERAIYSVTVFYLEF